MDFSQSQECEEMKDTKSNRDDDEYSNVADHDDSDHSYIPQG